MLYSQQTICRTINCDNILNESFVSESDSAYDENIHEAIEAALMCEDKDSLGNKVYNVCRSCMQPYPASQVCNVYCKGCWGNLKTFLLLIKNTRESELPYYERFYAFSEKRAVEDFNLWNKKNFDCYQLFKVKRLMHWEDEWYDACDEALIAEICFADGN